MTDTTDTLARALEIVNGPKDPDVPEDFPGWEKDWADELIAALRDLGPAPDATTDAGDLAARLFLRHTLLRSPIGEVWVAHGASGIRMARETASTPGRPSSFSTNRG